MAENARTLSSPPTGWEHTASLTAYRGIFENAPINMIFCDLNWRILYLNAKSLENLAKIKQYLHVPLQRMVGSHLEVFLKLPSLHHQSSHGGDTLPQTIRTRIGQENLTCTIQAVRQDTSQCIGFLLTWDILPAQSNLETLTPPNNEATIQKATAIPPCAPSNSPPFEAIVESVPACVLYCDNQGRIEYINSASQQKLQSLKDKQIIDQESIIGMHLEAVFKSASHPKPLLPFPIPIPHRIQTPLGSEWIELLVTPVPHTQTTRSGHLVTWDVISAKLTRDKYQARLQSMLHSMPFNVLMADRALKIVYLNRKANEELKRLQRDCCILDGPILGKSMDTFFNVSEEELSLLSYSQFTPHWFSLKWGQTNFKFHVSPVFYRNKIFLGSMIVWNLVDDPLQQVSLQARSPGMTSSDPEQIGDEMRDDIKEESELSGHFTERDPSDI